MKVVRIAALAVTTGAIILGIASPLAAWHPEGVIKKEVANQTAGTALSDANNASTAVAAKPGDVLKYVITVSNIGKKADNGYNDMVKTVMTDTLPAGVELVSAPAQRQISENLGRIKPGESVKKEYLVKVTSTKNGAVIENNACFTGDSEVNDAPQKDCDTANVKVNVPPVVTEPPVTPPVVTPPQVQGVQTEAPAVLPSTGPEAIIGGVVSIGAMAYGISALRASRRNLAAAHKQ
jgi:uncharacterized repeat protein (TIGR01451 family)